jgi:N-acetylmuramoyl-L-alanine amidase
MIKLTSPNFDDRQSKIDMLVLHYTGRPTLDESLDWLTDPEKKVSAHYLISEEGDVYQLVDEDKRAWHAGVSFWQGVTDINSCSIGIEIQNPGHEFGYEGFPKAQIEALVELAKGIMARHKIPANRVLGHSDIAPSRKQDPGEKFPWEALAKEGIGVWPEPGLITLNQPLQHELVSHFYDLGYDLREGADIAKVITAFQRHWRPEKVDGFADEQTCSRLMRLLNP